jgi:SCP-2 sterol transfer family
MERLPSRFLRMPGLVQFPLDANRWPLVRYRFDLEADRACRYDLVVAGGKARLEPSENAPVDVSLRCDRATFVLMMYKRLSLDPGGAPASVTVEGDHALVAALDQWLQQP